MNRFSWIVVAVSLTASFVSSQDLGYWERRPDLSVSRQEVGAAVLNGKVYVIGGIGAKQSCEVYDPATRRWAAIPSLPVGADHMAVAAAAGKIYVMGGIGAGARTQVYDPRTNRWTRAADMPVAREQMVGVTIQNKIYVVGGVVRGVGSVGHLTVYDPATNRWQTLPSMPTARNHLGAAALGGKLYVAGGRAGRLFADLEMYDPASKRWTKLPPMPTARGGTGAAALDGKLIVMGGEGNRLRNDGIFPQTEEYDPSTRKWRKLRDMNPGLHGIYPVTIGDEIFVAGGATRQGFGRVRTVLAFRRLPDGVRRYGTSTPACSSQILLSPSQRPLEAVPFFRLLSSPHAPPSTAALLVVGSASDARGTPVLGMRLHVGLSGTLILLAGATTAKGEAAIPLGLPRGTRGLGFFTQMAFLNTAACRGPGPLSASTALAIQVR